jgi:23S rRNA pseudouridine1911/1915/1917 synthase
VGERLDLFLALADNTQSRATFKKIIQANQVTVNGKVEFRANYRVKKDDVIDYKLAMPDMAAMPSLQGEEGDLDIIYEDDDLLVLNKPVGIVVHPATGNWTGTIMNTVLHHFESMGTVGNPIRSGLIHRLDKDTSGVLLIAKSNQGLWFYSNQFAQREVEKHYLALCAGNFTKLFPNRKSIEVENYLGRNQVNRKKHAVVSPSKGRKAITQFNLLKVIKVGDEWFSLVEAMPKTGRTHQIRVHLTSLGLPILGDVIYGKGHEYKRLMLHAWKLKIKLVTGKNTEFVAPIPTEFNELTL